MEKMSKLEQHKPIEYAVLHGCTETVQQLLRAGCSFDLRGSWFKPHNVFAFAVQVLQVRPWRLRNLTLYNNYFEIVKIIIQELVLRRRNLVCKILNAPLVFQSRVSIPDSDQILDSGTVQAETFLHSVDHTAPQVQSILSGSHTVYHCPFLTVKVANELWSAGFREVDVPDGNDETPLMVLEAEHMIDIIQYAFWLHQKGASIRRPYPATLRSHTRHIGKRVLRSERRATHFIVTGLKTYIVKEAMLHPQHYIREDRKAGTMFGFDLPARLEPLIDGLSLDCRRFLDEIMLDDSPDNCLCACSGHGCLPITCFLKDRKPFTMDYNEEIQEKFVSQWILHWLYDNVSSGRFPTTVNREIVRLKTFEYLGLRHTCCRYGRSFWAVDTEDPDEIRDEDREGIQLLKSLLSEFEKELGDEDVISFLYGYWVSRMEEVLTARDKDVDVAGMKEAGVIVHDWNFDDGSVDGRSVDGGSVNNKSVDDKNVDDGQPYN